MKKILVAIIVVGVFFIFTNDAECRRRKGNLYNMLSDKKVVKTVVPNIVNSSGNDKADTEGLRKILDNALTTRMTINFKMVSSRKDADIVIACDIIEFFWTNKDPVDNIWGLGAAAHDALTDENYSRMQAVFTVYDAQSGKELWSKKLKATITSKTMTERDSISMVNERLVKIFMRDCFSKTRGRR